MKIAQLTGLLAVLIMAGCSSVADLPKQSVGAGAYRLEPASGDRSVPEAPYRTTAMLELAAPTNQWYSSVMYTRWSEVLHAHPLTVKATESGLEVGLPSKTIVPTVRRDVEVHYPHVADLTISPIAFQPEDARLASRGDWSVDISMASAAGQLLATVSHGSPFVYLRVSSGDLALQLPEGWRAEPLAEDSRVLRIESEAKLYAAFAPSDAEWSQSSATSWRVAMPSADGYLSVAALPDSSAATMTTFTRSAYAFVSDTKAEWQVDHANSRVLTNFTTHVETMEGEPAPPIIGLYPHHYHDNSSLPTAGLGSIASIRGAIRLFASSSFSTDYAYYGFVPFWPAVAAEQSEQLAIQISRDSDRARRMMLQIGYGPYWQGKGLARITQLMHVAHNQSLIAKRDRLLQLTQQRMQQWLSGANRRTYFHYDPKLGTVVSYPEEYDAVRDMNDHHFHYGYWIRAAADIAIYDPEWARSENWGGMIDLLIADIATTERGRSDFPYLRNFDPYEGHSWASGVALSPDGNNQESSSEAVNAWASLIIWGELQQRPDLVELGMYLYSTEIQSVNHYWFDIHGLVLPEEYLNEEVSMVFGGKLMHNTWWIDEPRQIHGINLLPITASSTYLGLDKDFVRRNLAALDMESEIYQQRGRRAKPVDIWQDLFAKYLALADPEAGWASWDEWGSVELGDTRSHTLHWLLSLRALGTPDFSVHADTPLYAVFVNTDGDRSYLAYNASASKLEVSFSDGTSMLVEPASLAIKPESVH